MLYWLVPTCICRLEPSVQSHGHFKGSIPLRRSRDVCRTPHLCLIPSLSAPARPGFRLGQPTLDMAETLAIASSVLAVIDISAKVLNLCGDYLSKVKSAKDDIRKLLVEVTLFSATAHQLRNLVDGAGADTLKATKEVSFALEDARQTLDELEQTLRTDSSAMRSFGRRALEWPFKSKSVEKTISNLARRRDIIHLAMGVDQTFVLHCYYGVFSIE